MCNRHIHELAFYERATRQKRAHTSERMSIASTLTMHYCTQSGHNIYNIILVLFCFVYTTIPSLKATEHTTPRPRTSAATFAA